MPTPGPDMMRFFRRDAEDKLMFGWVRASKHLLPAVSIERTLAVFAKEFGLRDFNAGNARLRYYRMEQEFFDSQRNTDDHGDDRQAEAGPAQG